MKKLLSLALALALCLGLAVPAAAYIPGKMGVYTTISACSSNTAAIDENGTLWMWGFNRTGQLGNGTSGDENESGVPVKVMENVVSVSLGTLFAAAIQADGSLWMWGSNTYGQLGNGTRTDSAVPVKVMEDVAAVSCGSYHTAALKTDGSLWIWGNNSGHQLGNDTEGNANYYSNGKLIFNYQNVPLKVMDHVAAVSCGQNITAVIKTDGSLWTWGEKSGPYLGDGTKERSRYPVKIMDNVSSVVCGDEVVGAIKTDGSLWMWGYSPCNGALKLELSPVKVMDGVAAIDFGTAGTPHGAILKTDGSLWMWGGNEYAQLGIGTYSDETSSYTPIKVLDNVAAVSCGTTHTAALKKDGTLWTWGNNSHGELGNNWLGTVISNGPVWVDDILLPIPTKMMANVALPSSVPVPSAPTVAGFSDVYETDYYADAVQWARETGVTAGTSATTFSPSATITRAEAMTFLWVAAGRPEPATKTSPFSDVTPSDYCYKPVLWAAENGITGGVSPSIFGRNNTLTYDQILTFLRRASGDSGNNGDWSAEAVSWAEENGLTDGLTFTAKGGCPRADVIYCLWKQLA